MLFRGTCLLSYFRRGNRESASKAIISDGNRRPARGNAQTISRDRILRYEPGEDEKNYSKKMSTRYCDHHGPSRKPCGRPSSSTGTVEVRYSMTGGYSSYSYYCTCRASIFQERGLQDFHVFSKYPTVGMPRLARPQRCGGCVCGKGKGVPATSIEAAPIQQSIDGIRRY